MKLLFILLMLTSGNAFCMNPCSFLDTPDFFKSLEAKKIRPSYVSKNHSRFNFNEKHMIHLTITLQEWFKGISREESLTLFAETLGKSKNLRRGEIIYYNFPNKKIALVHYWPDSNEYGAFYEIKNNSYRLLAQVSESFIYCP